MAFTVQDFHELVRLLNEHPEWREELRRLVLADDLLRLPALMQDLAHHTQLLAEAQQRTEAQVQALAARLEALAARVEALTAQVEALAEAQQRTEQRVAELAEHTDRRLSELQARLDEVVRDLGQLKADNLEHLYREGASSYFSAVVTHLRLLRGHELDQVLVAAAESAVITWEERDDVLRADLVARGRLRSTGQETYLVAEVSWGVAPRDVERAHRRAEILGRASGLAVAAVVAGRSILPEAAQLAQSLGVAQVVDGAMQS